MAPQVLDSQPARHLKQDVAVMLARTTDDVPAIQALWPRFERLTGLRGRKMYAMVLGHSYATCTPVKPDDDPAALGLETGVLPGGWYLTARIAGEPPALYDRIAPAMQAVAAAAARDDSRPLVEYYKRRDQVELWVPVQGPRQSR